MKQVRVLFSVTSLLLCFSVSTTAAEPAWAIAGKQGLVQFVVVPTDKARDRLAYEAQIKQLCAPETTCFINFYTNTTNAAVSMPLPDAIDREATVIYRRSMKNGVEKFQWSCRLNMSQDSCF